MGIAALGSMGSKGPFCPILPGLLEIDLTQDGMSGNLTLRLRAGPWPYPRGVEDHGFGTTKSIWRSWMRKPLATLSIALGASLGVATVADTLAATPTANSPTNNTPPSPPALSSSRTAATTPSNAVSGAQIVQYALKYIGYPYTATGNSPATGFSCIGFASYVYRSLGIPLPGDLQDALNYAPQVPFSQLQPGDLIYFHSTLSYMPYLSHVAIYIGGGKFVHAEYYGYGVRVSSFNNDPRDGNYWIAHYMTANRPWAGASISPVINTPGTTAPAQPSVSSSRTVAVTGGRHSAVTVPSLNVRSGPSKSNSVVTVINRGTDVTIVGKSNGWYKVQLADGTVGWVVAYGIGLAHQAPTPSTTPAKVSSNLPSQPTRTGYPSTVRRRMTSSRVSGLRVHSAPSVGAPVITSLAAGQKVVVLGRSGGWTKVELGNGQVGYIATAYTSASRAPTSVASVGKVAYRSTTRKAARRRAARSIAARPFAGGPRLTAGVNIRATPSVRGRLLGTAIAGTHVRVLGYSGRWDLVRISTGLTGYVFGIYVKA